MKTFQVGDRVRVRAVRAVGAFAGRVGTGVEVHSTLTGAADGYRVKLDMGLSGSRDDKAGIFFGAHELEFVATGRKSAAKTKGKGA